MIHPSAHASNQTRPASPTPTGVKNVAPLHRFVHLLVLLTLWLPPDTTAQPCREVAAYYPSWKWYSRNKLVRPENIPYHRYSSLQYAFFKPLPDGSVRPFDPVADKILLLGELTADAPPGYRRQPGLGDKRWHQAETSLVHQAHRHGVRILVSIGGWTLSSHFSAIAAHPVKRRRFASDCRKIVEFYQLDGIDIDWEYPGYSPQKGNAGDRDNFTRLLQEIRDSLDDLPPRLGRRPQLTAAFGVAPVRLAAIDWEKVGPLLDFIHLMTYDFYGGNYGMTNHHAPLFPPTKGLEGFDLHSSVTQLLDLHGVPPHKVNIGIAFYGRTLRTKGTPDLHVSSSRTKDHITFPEDGGTPMYYNILPKLALFHYRWDSIAQAPFLQGKTVNTFVSFEDEQSVAQKARYVLRHQLAGAIVWDITGDCLEDQACPGVVDDTPLARVLAQTLCEADPPAPTPLPPSLRPLPFRPVKIYHRTFVPRITDGLLPAGNSRKNKKDNKVGLRRRKQASTRR
ncbi:MAG: hypothetical protein RLY31_857 [Bacteroidota bacterium]|jgi:chitinase